MRELLALKASAGTGKTYALALRYLARLFQGSSPYDVLAITFTNKAANEMRERVAEFLKNMDEELLCNLSKVAGIAQEELLKSREKVLQKFMHEDLLIMTIDAFVQKILRKFAYYGGVATDFEVTEKIDLFEEFIESMDENELKEFISFTLWHGSKLEQFFSLLYEKDKELPLQAPKPLQDNTQKVLQLYHKIAAHVQEFGSDAKKRLFKQVESIDEFVKTSNGIRSWLKENSCKIPGVKKCEEIETVFQDLKRELRDYFAYKESQFLAQLFHFYWRFRAMRLSFIKKENILSFTDIKHITYDLLQHSLQKDFLYFRLDSRLAHIMIDEFQDTSVEDWEIFEPLVDEIAAGEGAKDFRSFFYVGDTKQSIYGFRGGMPELFDYVAQRYSMDIEELNVNYRSKKEIVAYVNEEFGLHQKWKKDGGYVEVCESEDILQTLKEKLQMLFDAGVASKDIAILVPTNKDILKVADFIEETFGIRPLTSTSKLIIHQPFARAVIEAIKYLANNENTLAHFHFCAVAGVSDIEQMELDKPVHLIRKICDRYGLWDASTVALMQEALMYKDIEEFLLGIEGSTTQMPNSSSGMEVLTIHKSKGLDFAHTIVLDVIGVDRPRSESVIFEYDGVKLQGLRLRQQGREYFDEEYAKVLEKVQEKEKAELRNVAYVALTRAVNSLIVLKKPKSRRFGFLHTTKRGAIEVASSSQDSLEVEPFAYPLQFFGKQEFLEEQEYKPNDYEAIYKGEAYHKSFEIGCDYVKSRYALFHELDDLEKRVKEAREKIEKLFKGDFYKEIPFVHGERLGIIDLLIEDEDSFIVIDYKSTKPADESTYIKQVTFYKDAVAAITGKKVQGFLYYLDENILKKV
ncbi:RecB-like helicase [Nitratiruptor tergarcus]|uniref:DNA 3'-5' helicase n=1 Tax=Nitratiruptor tergarcus DSM 16512 TaxID=1069081 RepID=A0A1W1WSK8_9BACT|nr:RecB-like helicase [Nitratiruptor tergarcus]SMC09030.1 ATP-dependent exoDNAse (exonuclease V) beta subunit (contains helicase and exonuclease domains) [Nitratiruptor tergarcus DSM 16512]